MSRPSSFGRLIVAAAIALVAGLALYWSRPNATPSAGPTAPPPVAPVSPSPMPGAGEAPFAVSTPTPPASEPGSPPPPAPEPGAPADDSPERDQAIEAIHELAITYDAASVPALARYLSHADAEVRTAARDGLIQLGERAAIPPLQEAARHAPPEEAQALREAADFLALPTWSERRAALKAKTPAP